MDGFESHRNPRQKLQQGGRCGDHEQPKCSFLLSTLIKLQHVTRQIHNADVQVVAKHMKVKVSKLNDRPSRVLGTVRETEEGYTPEYSEEDHSSDPSL